MAYRLEVHSLLLGREPHPRNSILTPKPLLLIEEMSFLDGEWVWEKRRRENIDGQEWSLTPHAALRASVAAEHDSHTESVLSPEMISKFHTQIQKGEGQVMRVSEVIQEEDRTPVRAFWEYGKKPRAEWVVDANLIEAACVATGVRQGQWLLFAPKGRMFSSDSQVWWEPCADVLAFVVGGELHYLLRATRLNEWRGILWE